jgi:hypothetical protein
VAGPGFEVQVFQNEYLPSGGRVVDAIVTVTAESGPSTAAPAAEAAEVIIIDTSSSMDYPPTTLRAAKYATAVAVDALRDGVWFGVVAGSHQARMIYPPNGLVRADATTRGQAKIALSTVRADGGTAIGQWLLQARLLLAGHPRAIRHAILLTDGRNQHERPDQLQAVLDRVQGEFTCDCRGVGTSWEVDELRRVATALLGTVDIVAEPAGLAADFRAMTDAAMGKQLAEVALRLWTPQGSAVRFVKQVAPDIVNLTERRVPSGPRTGDYPTGSWGAESRDYHVCVEVPVAGVGERMLAGRVSMVVPAAVAPGGAGGGASGGGGGGAGGGAGGGPAGEADIVLAQGRLLAVWTDDEALSTRLNREVAHYTGQGELAEAIQQGLAARKAGDLDQATAKLGRAVALATAMGNEDTARLLANVVDVDDPVTGTVRLRARVATADEMTLDTRSTRTARMRRPAAPPAEKP